MKADELSIAGFKVGFNEYDLCRGQEFISIRDQAVRVRTLLWSLKEAGMLDKRSPKDKVLVVGAGYAGASAALWLAEHGHNTVIVESSAAPFHLQANCNKRWISLTQYDWPAPHAGHNGYPTGLYPDRFGYEWLDPERPTPGTVCKLQTHGLKRSSEHAADWLREYNAHDAVLPDLELRRKTKFIGRNIIRASNGSAVLKAELRTTEADGTYSAVREDFVYIFHAEGFGNDAVKLGSQDGSKRARTPGFWENDLLADLNVPPPQDVMISGGGDGAIQDALRVLFDPAFKTPLCALDHLYERMGSATAAIDPGAVVGFERDRARFEHAITFAEEQAAKAYSWLGNRPQFIWDEVHGRFYRALADLAKSHAQAMLLAMEDVLARPMPADRLAVVHTSVAMKKCFALNRLLYMLCVETFRCWDKHDGSIFFGQAVTGSRRPTLRSFENMVGCRLEPEQCAFNDDMKYEAVWTDESGALHNREVDALLIRNGPKPLAITVDLAGNNASLKTELPLGRFRLPYVAIA